MDIETTHTDPPPTTNPKPRAATGRYYIADGAIVRRETGKPDAIVMLVADTLSVEGRLAHEGIIALLIRGETPADIVSGKAIPDRALPAEKVAKAKPLTLLQRAVLDVRQKALTEVARKVPGAKVDKAAIATQAETDVRALTPEQLAKAEKLPDVQHALVRLRGGGGSLDDLFAAPADASVPDAEDVAS